MGLGSLFKKKKDKAEITAEEASASSSKKKTKSEKDAEKKEKKIAKHNQKESKKHAKALTKRLSEIQTEEDKKLEKEKKSEKKGKGKGRRKSEDIVNQDEGATVSLQEVSDHMPGMAHTGFRKGSIATKIWAMCRNYAISTINGMCSISMHCVVCCLLFVVDYILWYITM